MTGATRVLSGGLVLTMREEQPLCLADVAFDEAGDIVALGPDLARRWPAAERIDVSDHLVMPGFVQSHLHLTQSLFRTLACDRTLLAWLRERIWPLEAAHDPESNYAAARLGIADLLLGGTTSVITMETVHHTDAVFEAAREMGIRAWIGKAMMDRGEGVPAPLMEDRDQSIRASVDLIDRWEGAGEGRLHGLFAPRFILSCTDGLWREVAELARRMGVVVHTHASESPGELEVVRSLYGRDNIHALADLGLFEARALLAHCVHPAEGEVELLARQGATVAHCPSSNLKLGSGIAPVRRLLAAGVNVGIGVDGAPCNDRLDALDEVRLAASLAQVRSGVGSLSSWEALVMATRGGARAVGEEHRLGAIEAGRRADVIVLQAGGVAGTPRPAPFWRTLGAGALDDPQWQRQVTDWVVYAARRRHVRRVFVQGVPLVEEGRLVSGLEARIAADAQRQIEGLMRRAALP